MEDYFYTLESPSINGGITFSNDKEALKYAEKHFIIYRIKKRRSKKASSWTLVYNNSYPIKNKKIRRN